MSETQVQQQQDCVKMPAVTSTTEDPNDADQKMWNAIKRYITRDRQRKKEEYEAEVEEERLRKEREARERQDVMTLEETKEQIEQLEQKLKTLEKEKQQLFMQLKKVLNEDEVRKRQQQKVQESNEMQSMKMPMGNIQMPMFSMASAAQGEPPPNQGRHPQHSNHLINKPLSRDQMQAGVKRQRSPSPTYALYAHRLHQPPMKHQPVYSDHSKLEDNRLGRQMARAVLWNKPPQYASNVTGQSVSGGYYSGGRGSGAGGVLVTERPPPLLYAHPPHHAHPAHPTHPTHSTHHAPMLINSHRHHHVYNDVLKRDPQHQEKKDQQVFVGVSEAQHGGGMQYAPPVSRHLTQHPRHNMQTAKPGSITQGYPVQQNNPNVQNPNIYPNRHRY